MSVSRKSAFRAHGHGSSLEQSREVHDEDRKVEDNEHKMEKYRSILRVVLV
jgi:hypothetical protein